MSEARDAERLVAFEDRRMWRLLLARLHPDAGEEDGARSTKGLVTPFLRAWQETMDDWSSGNRDALRNLWRR